MNRWRILDNVALITEPSAYELLAYFDAVPRGWQVKMIDCRTRDDRVEGTKDLSRLHARNETYQMDVSVLPGRRFVNKAGWCVGKTGAHPRTIVAVIEADQVTFRAVTVLYVMLRQMRYSSDEAQGLLRYWAHLLPLEEAEAYCQKAYVWPTGAEQP